MFTPEERQQIADAVQHVLQAMHHPDLPDGPVEFHLSIRGKSHRAWEDIIHSDSVIPSTTPGE